MLSLWGVSPNISSVMNHTKVRFGHAFRFIRKAKRYLKPLLAVVGLILLLIVFYVSWPDMVAALRSNSRQFLVLILLNFLIYWIQGKTFSCLIDPGRHFPKLFFVWGASNLMNYVTAFHSGLLLRGKYFVRYGYTGKEIVTKTVMLMCINMTFSLLLLLISVKSINIWILIAVGIAGLIGFTYLKFKRTTETTFWQKYFSQCLTFKVFLLSAAYNFVLVLSIYSTLPLFGIEVSFLKSVQIASSLSLSSVVSLMPNNIGIQEGLFVAFSSGHQAAVTDAISASAFFRAASIAAGLILTIAQGKFLLKLIQTR